MSGQPAMGPAPRRAMFALAELITATSFQVDLARQAC